jgi:chlorite dismutase
MPMESVTPSIGWGVLHLFYRVDRVQAEAETGAAKRIVDAVASLDADDHHVLVFAVLGHKADLGIMAYGPDLARLHAFQQELLAGPLAPDYSYVSLTELSEYSATEDDERARLRGDEGLSDPSEIEERLTVWRDRIEHYRENRIHPRLPERKVIGFYPMS